MTEPGLIESAQLERVDVDVTNPLMDSLLVGTFFDAIVWLATEVASLCEALRVRAGYGWTG